MDREQIIKICMDNSLILPISLQNALCTGIFNEEALRMVRNRQRILEQRSL